LKGLVEYPGMPITAATGETAPSPRYSLVLPVFNEEENIPVLAARLASLLDQLDGACEVILVNDGSRDNSLQLLVEAHSRDPRFKVVSLSRNFGHQIAISAGIDMASGDAVIIMDSDLQDPPEVVLAMVDKWRQGYEIVYGVRVAREGESLFKRATAGIFYRLLRLMLPISVPLDAGDFRLVDRQALDAFRSMREHNRFVRGMFSWIGFRQTGVTFVRSPRAAGETKYPLARMLRLALNAVIGFSDLPLRLSIWAGVTTSLLSMLYGFYVIGLWLLGKRLVEGWTSTVVILTFLGGLNLTMTGIVGLYVGRIHEESKNRPLYIVKAAYGFDQAMDPRQSGAAAGNERSLR
jgi:polyisoprenyl-phosphate glycosyltransferase